MNLTNELERLHHLRQSGALSDDEFAQAKKSLLSGQPMPEVTPSDAYIPPRTSPLPQPPDPDRLEQDTRQWALMLHISALVGRLIPIPGANIAAVLLMWQLKKNELPGIEPHGKTAMNWAISQLIYFLISFLLVLAFIGIPLVIAIYVLGIIFPIMAAVKANNGELWKYPLSIQFLK